MKKRLLPIKITPEVKMKLDKFSFDLTAIEQKRISRGEIVRRAFNIPNISEILRLDAEQKRRLKR